jgi:hypothetical protein
MQYKVECGREREKDKTEEKNLDHDKHNFAGIKKIWQ